MFRYTEFGNAVQEIHNTLRPFALGDCRKLALHAQIKRNHRLFKNNKHAFKSNKFPFHVY